MSRIESVSINDLALDLANFRTVPQGGEVEAIKAMIAISPDYFLGLMESVISEGYILAENIIVLEDSLGVKHVKEGNRRVACLKIVRFCTKSTAVGTAACKPA